MNDSDFDHVEAEDIFEEARLALSGSNLLAGNIAKQMADEHVSKWPYVGSLCSDRRSELENASLRNKLRMMGRQRISAQVDAQVDTVKVSNNLPRGSTVKDHLAAEIVPSLGVTLPTATMWATAAFATGTTTGRDHTTLYTYRTQDSADAGGVLVAESVAMTIASATYERSLNINLWHPDAIDSGDRAHKIPYDNAYYAATYPNANTWHATINTVPALVVPIRNPTAKTGTIFHLDVPAGATVTVSNALAFGINGRALGTGITAADSILAVAMEIQSARAYLSKVLGGDYDYATFLLTYKNSNDHLLRKAMRYVRPDSASIEGLRWAMRYEKYVLRKNSSLRALKRVIFGENSAAVAAGLPVCSDEAIYSIERWFGFADIMSTADLVSKFSTFFARVNFMIALAASDCGFHKELE
jgi:hypothetical protein